MIQAMKSQQLLQKKGMSQTVKLQKVDTNKAILLNLRQKLLNKGLCDYSDAFMLVTRNIAVNAYHNTAVAFKTCAPFSTCTTKINVVLVDEANHIYIAMTMYNFVEYSDNYSDTSGRLWHFKRDEVPAGNVDSTIDNSQSFKYKTTLLGKTENAVGGTNSSVKDTKKVVPLKYLSNFWR